MEKATWQRELPSQSGGGAAKELRAALGLQDHALYPIPPQPFPSYPILLGTSPSPPSPVGMLEAPQRS